VKNKAKAKKFASWKNLSFRPSFFLDYIIKIFYELSKKTYISFIFKNVLT